MRTILYGTNALLSDKKFCKIGGGGGGGGGCEIKKVGMLGFGVFVI